jgi:phosphatidylinositol alpha-1,6-mannosyltransferase
MTISRNSQTRILFIARAFPPTLGGMENLAYQLSESMRRRADVTMLVNRRGKKALPVFLPYALTSALYLAQKKHIQVIHLADALLAPLGALLKKLTGLPVTSSVCGLDITYSNRLYQSIVPRALARLDMTMPISKATAQELQVRTNAQASTTVIPLGTNPLPEPTTATIRQFQQLAATTPRQVILLTVGRLIERKGIAWFVQHVLPALPEHLIHVIIGEGPERANIRAAAEASGVSDRVRLLGRVPDDVLAAAYRCADIFVMPNIPVPGDIEGFGLVALEAASSGLPVVASRLQGINEAVQHERNGFLVAPLSADEYSSTIENMIALPREQLRRLGDSFAHYTNQHYGWDRTAERYLSVIDGLIHPSQDQVPQSKSTLPAA